MKNSGYIVMTKDRKIGRTFTYKGLVNNKVPVYLAIKFKESVVIEYSDKAVLYDPKTLTIRGFIN